MYLPDSNLVDEDAAEEGQHHVGEGVNGVEGGPLGGGQVVGGLRKEGLERRRVVEAVVAAHEEEAAEGQHQPTPVGLPDQKFLLSRALRLRKTALVLVLRFVAILLLAGRVAVAGCVVHTNEWVIAILDRQTIGSVKCEHLLCCQAF